MRRILSILLVLILGLGPVVPAGALAAGLIPEFASGWTGKVDESRLPACCRRNGKHHCAMMAMMQQQAREQQAEADRAASVSSRDDCPFAPKALAATAASVAALGFLAKSSAAFRAERWGLGSSAIAVLISERRAWPKRGPPSDSIL